MKKIRILKLQLFEPFLWLYISWYYLPILRGIFNSRSYNYLFFTLFIVGCVFICIGLISKRKVIYTKSKLLLPVIIYMILMVFMYLLNLGDADRHIRVSFTFWAIIIIYNIINPYANARNRLAKLAIILFIVTLITSTLGVVKNPSAARTLTFSGNLLQEDMSLKLLNIGDIFFFQTLIILTPIIIIWCLKKKKYVALIFSLSIIFIAISSASFTISLIIYFIAIFLGFFFNNGSIKKKILIIFLLLFMLVFPWVNIIELMSDIIQNKLIVERLNSLIKWLRSGIVTGNLSSRIDLYRVSLQTFLSNPFGIGPEYSYIMYHNGIGYHSQLLDDLARYGVLAVPFYGVFFYEYCKLLKMKWKKINMKQIAYPVIYTYILFLLVNPGFTSPYESIMMFLIIPSLPDIIK